jgi:hypothetical protein
LPDRRFGLAFARRTAVHYYTLAKLVRLPQKTQKVRRLRRHNLAKAEDMLTFAMLCQVIEGYRVVLSCAVNG